MDFTVPEISARSRSLPMITIADSSSLSLTCLVNSFTRQEVSEPQGVSLDCPPGARVRTGDRRPGSGT
ncbi:hypothetical protein GCM10023334_087640 [Nonomuraea thailandensis]